MYFHHNQATLVSYIQHESSAKEEEIINPRSARPPQRSGGCVAAVVSTAVVETTTIVESIHLSDYMNYILLYDICSIHIRIIVECLKNPNILVSAETAVAQQCSGGKVGRCCPQLFFLPLSYFHLLQLASTITFTANLWNGSERTNTLSSSSFSNTIYPPSIPHTATVEINNTLSSSVSHIILSAQNILLQWK